jgi:hypothetical protein
MMEKDILASFLALSFVIFIAGFLAGILSIGLVPLEMDSVALFTIFLLGYVAGALTVILALVAIILLRLRK